MLMQKLLIQNAYTLIYKSNEYTEVVAIMSHLAISLFTLSQLGLFV